MADVPVGFSSVGWDRVVLGDCVEVLKSYPENSVDEVVTDPPYGLNFMGKQWDKALPPKAAFVEMCRVLKPGALAFVMSSPRQDLMWRMAQMLEESGFELGQSFISWVYACLSDDTEVLTRGGWERFCISNIFMSKEILIYNHETDRYSWEVPIRWNAYPIKDTLIRIKSDFTDQLVTRDHRCLVEREGSLLHSPASQLEKEGKRWKTRVPYLDCLSVMREAISDISRVAEEKAEYGVILLNKLPSESEYSEVSLKIGQTQARHFREAESGKKGINVGREKLGLEGGSDILQNPRQLRRSEIYSLSSRFSFNGSEGWLRDGASDTCCSGFRSSSIESGGSSSSRSRPDKQLIIQSRSFCLESGSQATRTRKSYRTTVATVTPEYYEGWVFCPTVSTGSFVARRNGKIFLTGNSGFPKAYDVSKGIDAKKGLKQEKVGLSHWYSPGRKDLMETDKQIYGEDWRSEEERRSITVPNSSEDREWSGWKSVTGLKPALEVIFMVQKPMSEKTIVDNVLRWGVGAMNVDACRIPIGNGEPVDVECNRTVPKSDGSKMGMFKENGKMATVTSQGRFPANLLVSDDALNDGKNHTGNQPKARGDSGYQGGFSGQVDLEPIHYEVDSFSRYFDLDAWVRHRGFLNVPKADTGEREYGLYLGEKATPRSKFNLNNGEKPERFDGGKLNKRRNTHPTVKPVELMAYLIELGCPRGGVVLDPFVGSGTTCVAAKRLNRRYVGIEIEEQSHRIACARVSAEPVSLDSWGGKVG